MTTLSERAAQFPEPWKPDVGDVLEGVVTETSLRDSEYGDPYTILTVLDDDGTEWAAHCFHTMLRLEVERKTPQVGDRIAVAYHGLGEAKPGMQPPHRYRLVVERQRAAEPSAAAGDPGPVIDPADPGPDEPEEVDDDGIPF